MTGTLINVLTILLGSLIGTLLGNRLAPRFRELIMQGLGLATGVIALQMALLTQNVNILIVTISLVIGAILGEAIDLEGALARLGQRLEQRLARGKPGAAETAASIETGSNFSRGFVTASLVFCVGPMAILGSFQDGLSGDFKLLVVKALLDGVASMAFAASLGVGVAFSAMSVLFYQGTLTLLAGVFSRVLNQPMINAMTVTGGIIVLGIALLLLDIRRIRIANLLPAIVVAPALVRLLAWLQPYFAVYFGHLAG